MSCWSFVTNYATVLGAIAKHGRIKALDIAIEGHAFFQLPAALRIAAALRRAGVSVEFFPEPRKLGQQLKLAAKRGFRAALIVGGDEFAAGTAQLKDLSTQTSTTIDWGGDLGILVEAVRSSRPGSDAA